MSYIIIGEDYPLSQDGVISALADGHRWLVFKDSVWFGSQVNLDSWTANPNLRLEGAGGKATVLYRSFDSGPLFYNANVLWRVHFSGLAFNGLKDANPTPHPICEFRRIWNSCFEDCTFEQAPAAGIALRVTGGSETANDVVFVQCHWTSNAGDGLLMDRARRVTIIGGSVRHNGNNGITYIGNDSFRGGIGTVHGLLAYDNGTHTGIYVNNAICVGIRNCIMHGENIRLASGTRRCMAMNNVLVSTAAVVNEGTNNVVQYNIDA